ncbi:MAG: MerR family transcriptional regulator [Bacteroidota bacterium]
MRQYSVQQLASLAQISVRTLHHYDQIGLLKPHSRTAAGYRVYSVQELLRLQQILFYKELDIPLKEIGRILDDPGFDPIAALHQHRIAIHEKKERFSQLLTTIDKTIQALQGEQRMKSDEEYYKGFSPEEKTAFEQYEREALETYDPVFVKQVNDKVKRWSKEKWDSVQSEGDEISESLAKLMGSPVDHPDVQQLIARHHAHLANFYDASAEMYKRLAQHYVEDPRFRKSYDKYRPGLTDYLKEAIDYYCENILSKK